MKLDAKSASTEDWQRFLGEQLREMRIRENLSQEELAALANVSPRAIGQMEHGNGSTVATLILVIRALKRTDWLEALAPRVTVSPLQALAAEKSRRPKTRVGKRQNHKEKTDV